MPVDPTTGNLTGSSPQVLKFQNDFLPAQETSKIEYRANLASYPLTTHHDKSIPGSELLAPGSFSTGHNPLVLGTPAAPYVDATTGGTIQTNKDTPAVANHRRDLAVGRGTPAIRSPPISRSANTITVNGNVHHLCRFGRAPRPTPPRSTSPTASRRLLTKIDADHRHGHSPPSISGGAITLHSGTTSDLSVTSSNSSAFAALGFTGTATALRTGGGTVGTGRWSVRTTRRSSICRSPAAP